MNVSYEQKADGFRLEIEGHPDFGKSCLSASVHQASEEYAAITLHGGDSSSEGCVMLEQEDGRALERTFVYLGAFEEPIILTPRMIQYERESDKDWVVIGDDGEISSEIKSAEFAIAQLQEYIRMLSQVNVRVYNKRGDIP